jgi:hypothetical protein
MSQRLRGQEAQLRVAVDGVVQPGSMFKVKDFEFTPRQDITETPFCGEDEDDLDFQHHGWDLSWSIEMQDAVALDLMTKIIQRELDHGAHPKITVTVIYTFREGALAGGGRVVSYHTDMKLKQGAEGAGSRKDYVGVKYEAKCKKRDVLQLA